MRIQGWFAAGLAAAMAWAWASATQSVGRAEFLERLAREAGAAIGPEEPSMAGDRLRYEVHWPGGSGMLVVQPGDEAALRRELRAQLLVIRGLGPSGRPAGRRRAAAPGSGF